MILIGERINSTRTAINEAIRDRNAAAILKEATAQRRSGADYIDVNCAMTAGDEVQDIDWVISVIQSEMPDFNICIDSPNYLAIDRALKVYKASGRILINSITADESRIAGIIPLAMEYGAEVIALTMSERGMPHTAAERYKVALAIADKARAHGLGTDRLLFDPLIRPISTEPDQAREFLASIPMIRSIDGARTVCGLSNISYGLPRRANVNAAFLAMAAHQGLDAAILDPTDRAIMTTARSSAAILGSDEYCGGYIKAFREGNLL